jgi:hypothetical protein
VIADDDAPEPPVPVVSVSGLEHATSAETSAGTRTRAGRKKNFDGDMGDLTGEALGPMERV